MRECTGPPAASPAPATPAASATSTRPLVARAQPAIPLWANGAPGALGATPADQPQMTPYLPPAGTANGTAVVIFPGGGYQHLSMEKEGSDIANWLAGAGVTTFVVRYRLGPNYHHPTDARRRAARDPHARTRAGEWGVDPRRLGVIGFSAGGHLASTTGTHFDAGLASSADPIERASSRPDFMMLIYPVITMRDSVTHKGSRLNLLGREPTPELVRLMSNEMQVTRETPPAFIVHTHRRPDRAGGERGPVLRALSATACRRRCTCSSTAATASGSHRRPCSPRGRRTPSLGCVGTAGSAQRTDGVATADIS